ncbi:MAG TPA: class I SAM-dependent methyltransferase [Spirochaetota bacterium]|nr:class I SAM-dependent methyltransferase [Spirochaetota bacterium]
MTATSRFDEAARTWDTPPRVEIARAVFGAIRDRGLVGPGTRALDFGAGTGLLTLAISDVAAEVTALDTSGEMLRVLGEKLAAGGVTNVRTVRADLSAGGTIGGKFDLVTSSMSLHHVRDTARLLASFHGLLAPGGRIALADLDREDGTFHSDNAGVEHFGFDRAELVRLVEAAGFSDVGCDIIHTVKRERDGVMRGYDIFLLTGTRA